MKGQCIDEQDLTGIISNGKCGTNAIPDAYGVCHCPDGFVESLDKLQCFRCESITGPKSERNRSKILIIEKLIEDKKIKPINPYL